MAAVHAFAYQVGVENQKLYFVILVAICVVIALALQLAGVVMTRRLARERMKRYA